MFTGIVEETGLVERIRPGKQSIRIAVSLQRCGAGLKSGDSLAVNGCCLTAVQIQPGKRKKTVHFDLLRETWRLTNLQFAKEGALVNLERPLRVTGRLDGHFVSGHVDGLGRIVRWERSGQDHLLDIKLPSELSEYIVVKGSVAVDGISLTVAGISKQTFRVWIIPHTFEVTALRERKVGDAVNIETDILGKYVKQFVRGSRQALPGLKR